MTEETYKHVWYRPILPDQEAKNATAKLARIVSNKSLAVFIQNGRVPIQMCDEASLPDGTGTRTWAACNRNKPFEHVLITDLTSNYTFTGNFQRDSFEEWYKNPAQVTEISDAGHIKAPAVYVPPTYKPNTATQGGRRASRTRRHRRASRRTRRRHRRHSRTRRHR